MTTYPAVTSLPRVVRGDPVILRSHRIQDASRADLRNCGVVGMMTRQGMVGDNAKVAHGKAHVVDATKTALGEAAKTALGEAAKTVVTPLDVNPAAGSATRVRVKVTLRIIDAP